MKFLDLLNESENKAEKRAKTVFRAFKEGTITRSDGVKFSYELGDNMVVTVLNGVPYIYAFITKIIERTYCPINEIAMSHLIREKFIQFGVDIDLQIPKHFEMVKYQGKKPWELNEPINESHEGQRERMIKKGKTVFKALRKGIISDEEPGGLRFSYELSNDISVDINNLGIVVYTDGVKIKELNKACDNYTSGYKVSRIRNKFYQFGIVLTYPNVTHKDVEKYEEQMNEGRVGNVGFGITEKELKKVKAVYKALKKGWFKHDKNTSYGYELPDDYYARRDELGNVCIVITGHNDQKPKFFTRVKVKLIDGTDSMTWQIDPKFTDLENWIKREVVGKFELFNIKFIF